MDPDIILLDEPTSALDPTMVGEVQAVIRALSKTGKTLMIVTHEMSFARAICNRVFYMDEGGIYEEGTPEQIFDNPQKEKTRHFIYKLKTLEINIRNKDYNFLETAGSISRFCAGNHILGKFAIYIHLAFEELVEQLLVQEMGMPHIRVILEYSEKTDQAFMHVHFRGPKPDLNEDNGNLSVMMVRGIVSDLEYNRVEESELPNRLVLHIKNDFDKKTP